jgi:hypothetical protein
MVQFIRGKSYSKYVCLLLANILVCVFSSGQSLHQARALSLNTLSGTPTDRTFYQPQFFEDKSGRHFIVLNVKAKKSLEFYNYDNGNFFMRIDYGKELGDSFPIFGFYVLNFDSIFLQTSYVNNLILVDSTAKVISNIDLHRIDGYKKDCDIRSQTVSPFFISNNRVYLSSYNRIQKIDITIAKNYNDKFKANNIGWILDLSDMKIENTIGQYPSFYQKNYMQHFHAAYSSMDGWQDTTIFISPISEEIYMYLTNKLIAIKPIRSLNVSPSRYSFDISKWYDDKYQKKVYLENGFYKKIIRDRQATNYYVFVAKSINVISSDGTYNSDLEREYSIIILNRELNVVKEIDINDKYLDFSCVFPVERGFMVLKNLQNGKLNFQQYVFSE